MDNWTVERNAGHAYGVDYRRHLKYWFEQLKYMPSVEQGQFGDLKYDDGRVRVWATRVYTWEKQREPQWVQIEVSDPDGKWHQIEQYIARNLPVSPWGGTEERERHERIVPKHERPTKILRVYNREAWAIDQGWPYPVPYFYGCGAIQVCAKGHWCSDSIEMGNSLRSDYGGIELVWLSMGNTYDQICPVCRTPLEHYSFDPLVDTTE